MPVARSIAAGAGWGGVGEGEESSQGARRGGEERAGAAAGVTARGAVRGAPRLHPAYGMTPTTLGPRPPKNWGGQAGRRNGSGKRCWGASRREGGCWSAAKRRQPGRRARRRDAPPSAPLSP